MRFNLRMLLYAVAVIAAGIGALGKWGWLASAVVLGFWWLDFRLQGRERTPFNVGVGVFLFFGLAYLLLPNVDGGPISTSTQCRNNLRQIAIALHMYHDTYGTFPAPYIADEKGQPMHSWRILIQPFLEGQNLYDTYDFSEPWDGPNNRQLANVNIYDLRCPGASLAAGETTVFAIVGPQAAWLAGRGRTLSELADGSDDKLLLIEAVGRNVNWLEPKDLMYKEALVLLTPADPQDAPPHTAEHFLYHSRHSRNALLADASVRGVPIDCDRDLAVRMLTIGGGEHIEDWRDADWFTPAPLHWPRIRGVAVFVLLAVLPTAWAPRRPRHR
jgi:hypothetical protein